MICNPNTAFTDSLERELLSRELQYYNDAPLLSFFKWVGAGMQGLHKKVVSYVAAVSTDIDDARSEGHKITAV